MLFVRGIKGKLKLNPALKIWGGLLLMLIMTAGVAGRGFIAFKNRVDSCYERGGVWIGGFLKSSYCAENQKSDAQW